MTRLIKAVCRPDGRAENRQLYPLSDGLCIYPNINGGYGDGIILGALFKAILAKHPNTRFHYPRQGFMREILDRAVVLSDDEPDLVLRPHQFPGPWLLIPENEMLDTVPAVSGHWHRTKLQSGLDMDVFDYSILELHGRVWDVEPTIDSLHFDLPESSIRGEYITVHDWSAMGRSPKSWPVDHWERLIGSLRLPVYQLGREEESPLPGAAKYLGNIWQSLAVMSGARLHIDIEGSLAHFAAVLGVPCITLCGPTGTNYFNLGANRALTAGDCRGCFSRMSGWMKECPLRRSPTCMECLTPERVIAEVETVLGS